jgi:alkanesulfonate monooxygenase SsuD/methylene tetrahydromethanopterin reductase-like flavin-dependent oxidoreductase (luciferase family)
MIDTAPSLWMLTSSGDSAFLAAHYGLAVSFAKFINPNGAKEAIHSYRDRFRPGLNHATPSASVGIFVFCSEDEEKIARARTVMDYRLLHIGGDDRAIPAFETASRYSYSAAELRQVEYNRGRMVIGDPKEVVQALSQLADDCRVDEIVVATFSETCEDRLESYRLLAESFQLKPLLHSPPLSAGHG